MARSRGTMKYLGVVSVLLILVLLMMGAGVGLPPAQASGDPTWTQTTFDDFFSNSEKSDVLVIDIGEGDGDVKLAYDLTLGLQNWPDSTETPTHGSQAPIWGKKWDAQTFTADADGNVTSILPYVGKAGSPGNLTVELRDTVSSKPGPTILASANISSSIITTAGGVYEVIFDPAPQIWSNTTYAIVLHQEQDLGSAQNSYHWYYDNSPGYSAGQAWKSEKSGDAGSWSNFGHHDFCFIINPQAQYYSSGYLISSPYDVTYSANFGTISWNATTPAGTSIKFQIATNNDNSTWNFLGPDGTTNTSYEISGGEIWSGHDADQYIKYTAYFVTTNTSLTPVLHDVSITYTQLTYTLTVNASPPEGGSVTGGGTYPYCNDVEVQAIPADECWYFVEWTGDVDDVNSATTTTHIDGNKTVTANFAKIQYTLAVNADPPEGGSVTGNGTYDCGTYAAINATASECYQFVSWTGDGITNPSQESTTVLIDGNKTVTANFAKIQYTLAVNADPPEGGLVTGGGTYDCGTYAAINATANESYQFVSWSGDSITDPSQESTTVLIDGNKTVTANFAKIQYTLTVNADPPEGGLVTGNGTYDCGTYAAITASPNACYEFTGWTGDGITEPTSVSTTVLMDNDKTVTANFIEREYTLTINIVGNGSVAKDPDQPTYTCGTSVNLTATADPGWRFSGWSGNLTGTASRETIVMDGDKMVTATFARRGGGGGGGGGLGWAGPVCSETMTVDFLGNITQASMKRNGCLCEDLDAPSPDGIHLLEIEKGTITLDDDGKVVKLIEITEAAPLSLPASTVIVGSAYNFSPSGIIFSQPVTLTLSYNVGDLPEDTLALSMAHYSSEDGWMELETESSQVAEIGSLTGTTDSFSVFAILADLPSFELSNLSVTPSRTEIWDFLTFAVRTGEEAVITVDVANTGNHEASYTVSLKVNGEIRATQEIRLAPGLSEQVVFTLSGNEPGQYEIVVGDLSEPFTSSLWFNWWLVVDILVVLAVIGLIAAWWYRRRAKPAPVE